MIKIGDKVRAVRLPADSCYHQVMGEVEYISNGYVGIKANNVMSKWSDDGTFKICDKPLSIATKINYVVKL